MNDTVARPRLAVLWRRVALVALSLVAVVQGSSERGAQGAQTNEPFPRAARLALPHDADAYFKAAAERGVDPAVQTEYGSMFLDIFYAADALKAFQAAVAADPDWAPGYAGIARTLADENPTAAAEAANKALA